MNAVDLQVARYENQQRINQALLRCMPELNLDDIEVINHQVDQANPWPPKADEQTAMYDSWIESRIAQLEEKITKLQLEIEMLETF